ncbi:MAG: hypothetical protein ACKOEC_09320, partial [Acidimicrobiia bacterium]
AQTIATGDEVKAAFADKTAYITHRNGSTQKAYFAADGTAKVTESKGTRAGTWTIEKNTIRRFPLDRFAKRLRAGIDIGKSLGAEFVLMNL